MSSCEPAVRPEILHLKRYIPGKPIDEVVRELALPRVVKLASNENPLGPSPKAVAAVSQALQNMQLYPDDSAYSLKKGLAAHLGIEEDHLVLGNGAVEIVRMLAEIFIEPGDEVIVGSPSFAIYREDAKQMGGNLVEVPFDASHHYNFSAMEKAVSQKTKMIVLCSPNNPTGTIIKRSDLEKFLQSLPKSIFVVLDEAYGDFVEDKNYPNGIDYVAQDFSLAVLRTFSKAYGLAGIRVGYGVTAKKIARHLNQVRILFNVNSLAQIAAIAALADTDHYEKTKSLISEQKKFLYSELKRLEIPFIRSESNFLAIQVGNDLEVFQSLLRLGVIVRPGSHLGMPGWLRVTIGTNEENLFLVKALEKTIHPCKTS